MFRVVAHYVIDPFNWFILLLFLFIYALIKGWKRVRNIAGMLFIAIWAIFVVSPLPVNLLRNKEHEFTPFEVSLIDTKIHHHILVLGAGKVSDPVLPPSTQLGGTVLARLVEGIRIYRQMPGARLISSASAVDSKTTQAKTVADAAVDLGVSSLDTLQLPGGYNTKSEARAYAERFGTETSLILVTSAAHMERAVFWFRYYGVEVIPAPCDYRIKEDPDDLENYWKPKFTKLRLLYIILHEEIGLYLAKRYGI